MFLPKMIIIIAAMTKRGRVIGKEGWLPWAIPAELALFRKLTRNSTVIMGRKTYEAINRALPERHNIVVSRSKYFIPDAEVCISIKSALKKAKSYGKNIFIIGGAEIYRVSMPFADKMYLSFIRKEYAGDTYFPAWDEREWLVEKKEDHPEFTVVVYGRKTNLNLS